MQAAGPPAGWLVKTNSQGWLALAIMAVITGLLAAGAATLDQAYRWQIGYSVVRGNGPCFVARIVPYLWALARIALAWRRSPTASYPEGVLR
jgi:hypothetical protein